MNLLARGKNALSLETLEFLRSEVFVHANLRSGLVGTVEFDLGFGEHPLKRAVFANTAVQSDEHKRGVFDEG